MTRQLVGRLLEHLSDAVELHMWLEDCDPFDQRAEQIARIEKDQEWLRRMRVWFAAKEGE
jgi:hypothetical protein